MTVLRSADLRKFESDNLSLSLGSYPQARRSLTIYSRRAVLNVAMLLRDSEIARQVRAYLLNMENLARTQPADAASLDDRIDQRITHILGKTVVPMFNVLIETSGEHHRELIALRSGVQQIEKRLRQHRTRLQRLEGPLEDRPLAGVMASMDAIVRLGAAKVLHDSEAALFVATCPFTRDALNIAAESGITAIHRGLLEDWSAGTTLAVLE